MKNVRILYLDANPVNIKIFRGLIESLKLPIEVTALTVTPSAQDALKYNFYDLIVSQIYPDAMINGLAILQTLRLGHYAKENQNIPAIAYTTLTMPGDKAKCFKAGFNSYVTMPETRKGELVEEILRLLGPKKLVEISGKEINGIHLDPHESTLSFVRLCLSHEFEKKMNIRSFEILEPAELAIVSEAPQFVICDGPSAITFVENIRAGVYGRELINLPILAFTTHCCAGDREAYLQAGFSAYIAKPANIPELAKAIKELLPGVN